jgi:hypothetical protein
MKSSGNAPPKLTFNFANIAAKFVGDICFAASILKPENPRLNKSVK